MSEYIGMSIEIGGDLPRNFIEEFLCIINNELSEITGPCSEADLKDEAGKGAIQLIGSSNYGMCDNLTAFCRQHNLSYIHHCDAKYDLSAYNYFWVPGMKKSQAVASNQDGQMLILESDIRPICDLMLAVIKNGNEALPLFIGNDRLKCIVEKSLKNPKKLYELLVKEINHLLPVIPVLPPFRIV